MFYSHQLLAKKAPLGQIWMAATMHAKINRRKLDKLNIIKICEEILNPSVPMALRLSGILMGGVVIVYERKVKLLYEDVTRLLIEINEAWKIKTVADPTVFPKGKNKAKYETVTLPDNEDTDIPGMELLSNTTTTLRFHVQPTTGLDMRLDHIEEHYINIQNEGGELPQNHHQADADNITMLDTFDTHQADTSMFNRFERFDIEDYEDGPMNSTIQEGTLIPSPPRQEEPLQVEQTNAKKGTEHSRPFTRSQAADEIHDTHPEPENNQQSDEIKDENQQAQHDEQRPRQTKRKAIKKHHIVMDFEQTIIVGQVYQTWLKDPSDILSERGRKKKKIKPMSTIKMDHLMELPPVALISGLPENGTGKIHYPAPLLNLWRRCTESRPLRDSPSGEISPPQPPASSSSPEPIYYNQDPMEIPVEDLRSAIDSQFKELSLEKMRNPDNMENPVVGINLISTPGNSGDMERSIPSSASKNDVLPFEQTEQLTSGRVGTKRLSSSLIPKGSGLAPVSEENPSHFDEPHFTSNFDEEPQFKLRRLSQNEPFHDHDDVLIETGPTQTQHPLYDYEHTMDKITDSIRRHLKTHFDTPGAPEIESLNQLTSGMNRKKAAQLFYQTCVLATHHLLKVEQKVPYADILISRGPKM